MAAAPTRQTEPASILVADEVWVALALLHRELPERGSFGAGEIRGRVEREKAHPELRTGVAPHISQQCVANVPPTSGTYRMLYRLPDKTYRLYRLGDECHPKRKGKISPLRAELPEQYHYLLDWYDREYCNSKREPVLDPVLAMIGVGKEIWQDEGGDAFINRLREEWIDEGMHAAPPSVETKSTPDSNRVWARIVAHQGELFRTVRGLPLTYEVEGNGIWFFRNGRQINRKLSRKQLDTAIRRCPLENTVVIKDLIDYAFLFAVLMDERIRQNDW